MPNAKYPSARGLAVDSGLGWVAGDFWVMGVTSTYVYSAAHDFQDDIVAGVRVFDVQLTSKTNVTGILDAADTIISGLTGSIVNALSIYKKLGGAESANPLILYLDTGYTLLPYTPNGANVTIQWPNTTNKIVLW